MANRYLYIKNGDIVTQMEKIASIWPKAITSGPDAFLFDFISQNQDSSILLLAKADRKASYLFQHVSAYVSPDRFKVGGKITGEIFAFIRVFLRALRYRPSHILCGTTGAQLWASYMASRVLSVPLVHSRHNRVSFDQDPWYRRLKLAIDGFFVRRADAVVCHGPYLKQELKNVGVMEDKLFEFDVSFADMQTNVELNEVKLPTWAEQPFLLYMGRIERNKGVFDLVEACSDLFHEEKHPFKLVFAGDGRYFKELHQEVEQRGLTQHVILLGKVPHEELGPIIGKSVAVVTPTHADFPEGRCMAAMEGLVMGIPVIAPAFGPFPYLVSHGDNGFLFEPGSVTDLKRRIHEILDNDECLKRLKEGASRTGRMLIEPPRSFAQAVEQAFELTSPGSSRTLKRVNR